jgi:hypothetical protein
MPDVFSKAPMNFDHSAVQQYTDTFQLAESAK